MAKDHRLTPFLWSYKPYHGAYFCEYNRDTSAVELQEENSSQATLYINKVSLEDKILLKPLPCGFYGAQHWFGHLIKLQYLIKDQYFS